MKQDYVNFETFAIACVIDTTESLRRAKESFLRIAKSNGAVVMGPNAVAAFVREHGLLEEGESEVPTGNIQYMELAEEWTQEMGELSL